MDLIEVKTINQILKDSEIQLNEEKMREFEYKINEKKLRTKMLKGAKRLPFEIIRNKSSINLDFNVGAWGTVVLPSIWYWKSNVVGKTCRISEYEISVNNVKNGSEAGELHVDTLITFMINGEKAVGHFYNTTQRVMLNGHGHAKFVDEFLGPYFKAKVEMNAKEINEYNTQFLENLDLPHNSVRSKNSGSFKCKQCNFVSKTITTLAKHSKNYSIE